MIAPDTTHIYTERPQRSTTSLIYPLPISVSGLMVPFWQILDPVAQESYSMRHLQRLNITFLPPQSNFNRFHSRDYSLPSCPWMVPPTSLQHPWMVPPTSCPFMSLAVFTNSQSSISLLNSASNLLAPNAMWTIWSSIAAYLIWPNCPSIGSRTTAIYVAMRSRTC